MANAICKGILSLVTEGKSLYEVVKRNKFVCIDAHRIHFFILKRGNFGSQTLVGVDNSLIFRRKIT